MKENRQDAKEQRASTMEAERKTRYSQKNPIHSFINAQLDRQTDAKFLVRRPVQAIRVYRALRRSGRRRRRWTTRDAAPRIGEEDDDAVAEVRHGDGFGFWLFGPRDVEGRRGGWDGGTEGWMDGWRVRGLGKNGFFVVEGPRTEDRGPRGAQDW